MLIINKDVFKNEDDVIIIHNMARCLKCGDIIESFHVHDFKTCSCKSISVDGGHEYLRRVGNLDYLEDLSESMTVKEAIDSGIARYKTEEDREKDKEFFYNLLKELAGK